jgi:enoyl-CoA hydratase/carnithine racemase
MMPSTETIRLWHGGGAATLPAAPIACLADGAVTHVVINRPAKRNALTEEIWRAIPAIVQRLADDPAVKLVVLRGAGTAAFSAGADIGEFPEIYGNAERTRAYNDAVRTAQIALERLAKPTLALVFGACVGGGCGLALACDLRFAAEDARFGITPARLGTAYSVPDTRRLVALVGPSRAKDILFSGRLLPAAEAAAIGMVDRLATAATLETVAADYASTLTANSRQSIAIAKQTVNAVAGIGACPEATLDRLFEESFSSRDFREGFAAFNAKRPPRFE